MTDPVTLADVSDDDQRHAAQGELLGRCFGDLDGARLVMRSLHPEDYAWHDERARQRRDTYDRLTDEQKDTPP